jgi:hypothetical protein
MKFTMKSHTGRIRLPNVALALAVALLFLGAGTSHAAVFRVAEAGGQIQITTETYVMSVRKDGFRFGFARGTGEVIAPAHADSGLEFAGAPAATTTLQKADDSSVTLEVVNTSGQSAAVQIAPSPHYVKLSVRVQGEKPGAIVARTGPIGPAFGLGDLGARKRMQTELTGYTNQNFHGDGGQCGRLISNFLIAPRSGFAEVNIEPWEKIVRVTETENAQGTRSALAVPALYYFFGPPKQIYASFLEVRNREGYKVYAPKYEWFGVGWEAFGALAWDTNEKTVTANVQRYLDLGYPLSWMVVGSGFWPRHSSNYHATTSFGLWDTNLYPHPKAFIQQFHDKGLKFTVGLRISFITNGPYADEGVKGGYFLKEDGAAKVFKIAFPRSPCYLLDAQNPAAVRWYVNLCQKWADYGVDGFKEDLFGYGRYAFRDDKLDPVNAALMDRGFYIMGRNGYLGSPMDLHRFEDFNQDQNQDRGPINGLTFAYSGFPYVYPDIVGGTFGEGRKMPPLTSDIMRSYMMRNAQYASVNPSMSMGMGPWKFESKQVEQVMLNAAQLHARLHPYIYSAAVDTAETGYPYTMTPLPLAFPQDGEVYQLENAQRRGYQWLLGPSLLACPLYGNDYATATTRDVYLPAGQWMDYDTGEVHLGPKTLAAFALPPGKTPLFVGGKGIVVERVLPGKALQAVVYPVAPVGTEYRFTHGDGKTQTVIATRVAVSRAAGLRVTDASSGKRVSFKQDAKTGAIRFGLEPGRNYVVSAK